jgi:hypothetical protein
MWQELRKSMVDPKHQIGREQLLNLTIKARLRTKTATPKQVKLVGAEANSTKLFCPCLDLAADRVRAATANACFRGWYSVISERAFLGWATKHIKMGSLW